jgi:hypothetical protein
MLAASGLEGGIIMQAILKRQFYLYAGWLSFALGTESVSSSNT